MKKTIAILFILFSIAAFSQDSTKVKLLKVEFDSQTWQTYIRNLDRLNSFAGRNVPNSEILLATKDTIQAFEQVFINQLSAQLPKKEEPKK